ncbi:MAG TPA: hypothetical protein VE890_11995 [Thermoguttaceae bacterium]|nr:hypothetical protein [Thermoguttaceae bacterium]
MNDDLTHDDVEQILQRLTPMGAPPQVRCQVLGVVEIALADRRAARLDHRCLLAVAVSVGLAAMLNVWVIQADDARQARMYGPEPVPKAIIEAAQDVASVTDAQTGRWYQERFLAAYRSRRTTTPASVCSLQLIPSETQRKDRRHETSEENLQVDPDHRGDTDRDTSGCQRHLGMADRFTA